METGSQSDTTKAATRTVLNGSVHTTKEDELAV